MWTTGEGIAVGAAQVVTERLEQHRVEAVQLADGPPAQSLVPPGHDRVTVLLWDHARSTDLVCAPESIGGGHHQSGHTVRGDRPGARHGDDSVTGG